MKHRKPRVPLFAAALALLVAGAAAGQVGPLLFAPAVELRSSAPPPLRLAERPGIEPLASLAPAAEVAAVQLEEVAAWNRAGKLPVRNGFARPLTLARGVGFGAQGAGAAGGLVERAADRSLVWGGEVKVAGAHRLRLHLAAVRLPAGSLLWVYGADGETVGPFGLELRGAEGGLWTPSVGGESVRLEVQLPAGSAAAADHGFVIDQVMEIVGREQMASLVKRMSLVPRQGECLTDVACIDTGTFDVVEFVERAVALIQFVDGGFSFICTGSLLNDVGSTGTPFFLTANHCLDNQPAASSVEAFWEYISESCGGSAPSPGSLPRSTGSTLLASNATSDFTLLSLNNIPSGRVFLGWNANASAVENGSTLHRVSHPVHPTDLVILPQQYSRSSVDTSLSICQLGGVPLDRPEFIYHTTNLGGTFGGSSGAATILRGPQPLDVWVVGQLAGGCPQEEGIDPSDGCDYRNAEVDGAFSTSYPMVAPFLEGTGCVPGPTSLCLLNDRFRVEVDWMTRSGTQGPGMVVPVSSSDSGLFYFFDSDNWEMLVKMVDACGGFDHFWVFYAATTDVEFTLTVTDTQSGMSQQYHNELGTPAPPVQDTSAFATCP